MLGSLESSGKDSNRIRRWLHLPSKSLVRAIIAGEFPILSELSSFTHRCRAGIETWRLSFFMTSSRSSKKPPKLLPSGTNEGLSSNSLPMLKTIYVTISKCKLLDEWHSCLRKFLK